MDRRGIAGRGDAVVTDVITRPTIPASTYATRLVRAANEAERQGFDALLVGVGSDMRYLSAYQAMPLERLTMLVVVPGHDPVMVVPRLEQAAAEHGVGTPIEILTWGEGDDAYALVMDHIDARRPGATRFAVSDTLTAMHLLRFEAARPAATFELASPVLRELRMIKDADEIALLTLAAHAADRVVASTAAGRLVGRTERDVALEVQTRLLEEGHDLGLFAIVGSGPNSASPHHDASDRVIQAGEPIVLDIGGVLGGYGSDITRTLWVTGGDPMKGPDARFLELFSVLYDAQSAATRAVRPGVTCAAIDAAARRPIEAAGFGEAFFHRTGHGIGLDGHEDPYLIAGNDLPLREGMAFSVEPGIYLVGDYGARIEDIVVCGPDGPVVLNEAAHELYVVNG